MAVGYFPNSSSAIDAQDLVTHARYNAPSAHATFFPDRPLFEHTASGAMAPRWIAFTERPRYAGLTGPDGTQHTRRIESEWRILGIVTAPNREEADELAREVFVRPVAGVQSIASFIAERDATHAKPLDEASREWWSKYRARLGARGRVDGSSYEWNTSAIQSSARARLQRSIA